MHELGIANSVLEVVRAEVERHPGAAPVRIGLRVGELSGVDPDALAFGFEALVAGTDFAQVKLDIERRPRQHRCPSCGGSFIVDGYSFDCPSCGTERTECIGGDELEVMYVELEQP